jgi:hypothetical protein
MTIYFLINYILFLNEIKKYSYRKPKIYQNKSKIKIISFGWIIVLI